MCFGCTCQSLSLSPLQYAIPPLSLDYEIFFPAISGPHLNAPSQVSEANELPATTAFSITVVPVHLENPLLIMKYLVSHTSLQRKGAESRPAGHGAPMGCRGDSEQQ